MLRLRPDECQKSIVAIHLINSSIYLTDQLCHNRVIISCLITPHHHYHNDNSTNGFLDVGFSLPPSSLASVASVLALLTPKRFALEVPFWDLCPTRVRFWRFLLGSSFFGRSFLFSCKHLFSLNSDSRCGKLGATAPLEKQKRAIPAPLCFDGNPYTTTLGFGVRTTNYPRRKNCDFNDYHHIIYPHYTQRTLHCDKISQFSRQFFHWQLFHTVFHTTPFHVIDIPFHLTDDPNHLNVHHQS